MEPRKYLKDILPFGHGGSSQLTLDAIVGPKILITWSMLRDAFVT